MVMSTWSVNLTTLFLDRRRSISRSPVLSAHPFASNWQLLYLNQRYRENGSRNVFMTNLHERMWLDRRIKPATIWIPGRSASNRATRPYWPGNILYFMIILEMSHLMTKPTKWSVRPVKTQTSLGICPVWSESLLSVWRKLGSLVTQWRLWCRLGGCPGWSESSLGAQSFCWFCHDSHEAAQILSNKFFYLLSFLSH